MSLLYSPPIKKDGKIGSLFDLNSRMKRLPALLVFLLFVHPMTGIDQCPADLFREGARMEDIHIHLKSTRCTYPAEAFLTFGNFSLSLGNLTEAKWALAVAEQKRIPPETPDFYRSILLKGGIFLAETRYEDAIHLLCPFILEKKNLQKIPDTTAARFHTMLIRAYFIRAGKKEDNNTRYLEKLYQSRYGKSGF